MPVRMPVRQTRVPPGEGGGQTGQWEQSEETLIIPAAEEPGGETAPEQGEKDDAGNPGQAGDGAEAGVGRPGRLLPSPETRRRPACAARC